jgi:microcystin-dependent protein
MGTPFMGQISIFAFGQAPQGWAQCNGQFLPINQNQALFSLLGTTYGGNGQTTFALPDMRGRVAMHRGSVHTQGERAGEENHTLSSQEIPTHIHIMQGVEADADTSAQVVPPGPTTSFAKAFAVPVGGGKIPVSRYSTAAPSTTMAPSTIGNVGGSQAHPNQQPFNTLNFCISLQGIFPSRN